MIKWEDRYGTGVEALDRQHRLLFEMFNDFEESIREGKGDLYLKNSFPLLEAYAQAHFNFEEDCMHQHQCPVAGDNKKAHQEFLAKVQELKKQYEANPSQEVFVHVHAFLEKWITGHIIGIDTHLKFCVKK